MSPGIGYFVVFGVVLVPVYVMLGGWFAGEPREFRLPLLGVGFIVGLVAVVLLGLWLLGLVTGFFVGY